jgi:hypothetical protein
MLFAFLPQCVDPESLAIFFWPPIVAGSTGDHTR